MDTCSSSRQGVAWQSRLQVVIVLLMLSLNLEVRRSGAEEEGEEGFSGRSWRCWAHRLQLERSVLECQSFMDAALLALCLDACIT